MSKECLSLGSLQEGFHAFGKDLPFWRWANVQSTFRLLSSRMLWVPCSQAVLGYWLLCFIDNWDLRLHIFCFQRRAASYKKSTKFHLSLSHFQQVWLFCTEHNLPRAELVQTWLGRQSKLPGLGCPWACQEVQAVNPFWYRWVIALTQLNPL